MIRVLEAFSGVGSQRMALRNIGVEHEVVAISEIDKFAIKTYESIHGKTFNLGDISKIKTENIPDHDLFTYSFPCQDISVAGMQRGLDINSGTRSGLLWECQKIIVAKKPKYLLLENVKNLVGKKHKHNFDKWLKWLEEQGYTNYWQVLNARDYNIPQNRERVFVVSIFGEHTPYKFPDKQDLGLRLKDILEDTVNDAYYLNQEKTDKLIKQFELLQPDLLIGGEQKNQSVKKDGICTTLTSSMGSGGGYIPMLTSKRIAGIFDTEESKHQAGSIWDKEQLAPTLDTMQGGWRQPSIIENDLEKSTIEPMGTIYAHNSETFGVKVMKNLSRTLKAEKHDVSVVYNDLRIRKLTPKECWRLMGFSDEDFDKAKGAGVSNTQLYKQAGNSIVVNVLEAIFKNLFLGEDNE